MKRKLGALRGKTEKDRQMGPGPVLTAIQASPIFQVKSQALLTSNAI